MPKRATGQVRVVNLRRFEKNTLRAFFDLELASGLIIRGATLQFSHGKHWVGLPSKPFQTSEGAKSWTPIIDFATPHAKQRFQAAALGAVAEVLPEVGAAEGRGA